MDCRPSASRFQQLSRRLKLHLVQEDQCPEGIVAFRCTNCSEVRDEVRSLQN